MKKDTVVSLKKPVEESDPLTALLRAGARQLLCEAVAAELAEYLSQYQAEHGRPMVAGAWSGTVIYRHGQ